MSSVCVLIGSNIEPAANTRQALAMLAQESVVTAVSSTWETKAVGSPGPNFLNTAVMLETALSPADLKNEILAPIENKLGRVRTADKYAPRTMDIDIVIYDLEIVDAGLWKHAFMALPVAELLPDLRHPLTGICLRQIAAEMQLSGEAKRIPSLLT